MSAKNLLISPKSMGHVDAEAARSGLDTYGLMQRAGFAVAAAALRLYPGALRFVVLCGPGNNGGDGYVAARALFDAGAGVAVFHLGDPMALLGDAAMAQIDCRVIGADLCTYSPKPGDVVIDAVFGAGLARDVPADLSSVIDRVTEAGLPVIAADLPSGIDGLTGEIRGAGFSAVHTVTFMCRKPGHVLLPGRLHCGTIDIVDIGIPWRMIEGQCGALFSNDPSLWQTMLPATQASDHKYRRGHLTVFSGGALSSGAARLAAMAGLKAGAGLVTLASPTDALAVNAAQLTAVMLADIGTDQALDDYLSDSRRQAFVLGPGFGDLARARRFAGALGRAGRRVVLDADGITAFAGALPDLARAFAEDGAQIVITPHEGEFARLFPDVAAQRGMGKVEKARAAAAALGGVVVYKGADTVIASADGRAVIEEQAPPSLATAGSGDVLAGVIGALLAQGMPVFEAACAGVHLHGKAALRLGAGLTAEELALAIRPA